MRRRRAGALLALWASSVAAATPSGFAVQHGRGLFDTYCVPCHGANRDGCGPRAKLYDPRPANLTMSRRSADYKTSIITGGGAFVGRSRYMPPWGQALSQQDIGDLVAYLSTLAPREPGC